MSAAVLPRPNPARLLRRRLRDAAARVDPLYLALSRWRRPGFAIHDDTALVLDGFPRSANSWLEACFRTALGEDFPIAQHSHAAPQIREGVRRGLPVIVLVRPPLDAVSSLLIRDGDIFSPRLALDEYAAFSAAVLPVARKTLVVPFKAAIGPFPPVMRALSEKFALDWPVPRWGEDEIAAARDLLDRLTAARVGRAHVSYSSAAPEAARAARAARTKRMRAALAADRRLARPLARAEDLCARLEALAPPALRPAGTAGPAGTGAP